MKQFFQEKIKKRIIKNRGFTLVELMVSIAIFAIIITMSTGAILILIDANAKAQALYQATSNVSYALDFMSREMRMGYDYNCVSSMGETIPTGVNGCLTGTAVAFTREKDSHRVGYRLNAGVIERKDRDDPSSSSWAPITSDVVVIDSFTLKVTGTTPLSSNNMDQPTAEIHIKGSMKNNNGLDSGTSFILQTFITQRRIDIL